MESEVNLETCRISKMELLLQKQLTAKRQLTARQGSKHASNNNQKYDRSKFLTFGQTYLLLAC